MATGLVIDDVHLVHRVGIDRKLAVVEDIDSATMVGGLVDLELHRAAGGDSCIGLEHERPTIGTGRVLHKDNSAQGGHGGLVRAPDIHPTPTEIRLIVANGTVDQVGARIDDVQTAAKVGDIVAQHGIPQVKCAPLGNSHAATI